MDIFGIIGLGAFTIYIGWCIWIILSGAPLFEEEKCITEE